MRFLAVAEAAVRYRLPVAALRDLCETGAIKGAVRFGRIWAVPEDTTPSELRASCAERETLVG